MYTSSFGYSLETRANTKYFVNRTKYCYGFE